MSRYRLELIGLTTVATFWLMACGRIDPQRELAAADASFASGDYRTAAIRLANVFQAEPGNIDARILRGRLALALGDTSVARDELTRALSDGAKPSAVALPLAEAELKLGDGAAALQTLDTTGQTFAGNGSYWTLRGRALTSTGRKKAAGEAFAKSAALAGETGRNLVGRASLAESDGDTANAERLLDAAVQAATGDPEILTARAQFRLRAGRQREAATDFLGAADLYASRPVSAQEAAALSSLVQIYLALNERDKAAEIANRLAARAPNAGISAYAKGLVAYERGEFADAAPLLQRAANADPDNVKVATVLGAVQLALGNLGQAEEQLLDVLRRTPDDPAAIKLLAETRLRQQRPEAALDLLRPLVPRDAKDVQLAALTGLANLQSGHAKQGIAYLEQAVALNPGNTALKLDLARAYLAADDHDAAIKLLDGAFGGDDQTSELSRHLMLLAAELRAGNADAGRARAQELVKEFGKSPAALTAAAAFYQLVGDDELALSHAKRAIAADGSYAPAHLLLAGLLVGAGRADEAEADLEHVVETNPEDAQALSVLAELAANRGDLGRAESLLRQAVEAAPSVATHLALARLLLDRGDLAAADDEVGAARALAPEDPNVLAARGRLEVGHKRYGEALRLLESAHASLPNRLDIVLALADAEAGNRDLNAARETLRAGLKLAPKALPLRSALGMIELKLGNAAEALDIAKALQQDFPAEAVGFTLEGETELAERRYDASGQSFATAFDRDPSWAMLARELLALDLAERSGEIEPKLRAWITDHPEDAAPHLALAGMLQTQGHGEQALAEYRKVLASDADNAVALNNAAWLLHEAGKPDALDLAKRAHEVAPENPAVLDTLGWILVEAKREQEGLQYLQQADALVPGDPEIRYHVAQAQARLGRTGEAKSMLEKLLAANSTFANRAQAEALLDSL